MIEKRKGVTFAKYEDDTNRKIVSMLEFRGQILVASERGVYRIKDDKIIRLEFVEKEKTGTDHDHDYYHDDCSLCKLEKERNG